VFKLLKALVSLICLGVFVWWGMTVQLGDRTLFGHIAAIGKSKESKDLVRGTKEKVTDLKKRIVDGKSEPSRSLELTDQQPAPHPAPAPQDRLTKADRRDMKRLLEAKRGKSAGGATN
jgi:hypothetical protein